MNIQPGQLYRLNGGIVRVLATTGSGVITINIERSAITTTPYAKASYWTRDEFRASSGSKVPECYSGWFGELLLAYNGLSDSGKEELQKLVTHMPDLETIQATDWLKELTRYVADSRDISSVMAGQYSKRYLASGLNTHALIPFIHRRGGKGKERKPENYVNDKRPLTGSWKRRINRFLKQNYKKYRSYEKLHIAFESSLSDRLKKSPEQVRALDGFPTLSQFHSQAVLFKQKEGLDSPNKEHPNKRPATKLSGQGSNRLLYHGWIQVDKVDSKIAVIHPVTGEELGRMKLYFAVDYVSGCGLGCLYSFWNESYYCLVRLLAHLFADKGAILKEQGIEYQNETWPNLSCFKGLVVDGASGYTGKQSNLIVSRLGVPIRTPPPYQAELKGVVESYNANSSFNSTSDLPGGIPRAHKSRGYIRRRNPNLLPTDSFGEIGLRDFNELNIRPSNIMPDSHMLANCPQMTRAGVYTYLGNHLMLAGRLPTEEDARRLLLEEYHVPVKKGVISWKGIDFALPPRSKFNNGQILTLKVDRGVVDDTYAIDLQRKEQIPLRRITDLGLPEDVTVSWPMAERLLEEQRARKQSVKSQTRTDLVSGQSSRNKITSGVRAAQKAARDEEVAKQPKQTSKPSKTKANKTQKRQGAQLA
jgi:hypothetical protein